MASALHDWQAAMTSQIARLDASQTTLAANQSATAVVLERLTNRIDSVRADLQEHQDREDRRPTVITGWMGGWGAIVGVVALLLCSGSALVVSIVSILVNHLK